MGERLRRGERRARWAIETAHQLGMTLPAIEAAMDVRAKSRSWRDQFCDQSCRCTQRNKFAITISMVRVRRE